MLRAAGIVALLVLLIACGQTTAKVPLPSPVSQGTWNQDLTFQGEVSGHMSGIVPDTTVQQSQCTGAKARGGQAYADGFFGSLDGGGDVWQVIFLVGNYRGPGTYTQVDATSVQVQSTSDTTKVWQNVPSNPVKFIVNAGQRSGTVNATLTNAATGKVGVTLAGNWNCRG